MESNTVEAESNSQYNFINVQETVSSHWQANNIYKKCKEKVKNGKKFYFLDGPPYTSGKVHVGTAWNKSLKDSLVRYKRMCGFNVWDRAGYDMHGLPTEKLTEKNLQITGGKHEIETKLGRDNFVQKCRELCSNNLLEMNKTFSSMGIWMDFENAYQSISKDFINGEWWFIKKAYDNGRLYQGKRPMYWDTVNATALAKHELEYEEMEDTAIFVRFKVLGDSSPNHSYFVVWTTTPWTIPFNLGVMVNPKAEYSKVLLKNFKNQTQYWYLAHDLVQPLLTDKLKLVENVDYILEQNFPGSSLKGMEYEHPFASLTDAYSQLKQKYPNVHTCVLSEEHVTTKEGTGIVHCAPGCGPEDYEVGHRNQLPAFNLVDETGMFKGMKPFDGLYAKTDDKKFIEALEERGAVVFQHPYVHEYPIGQRSKKPVIFRTTNQWFLKIEDLKPKLLEENKKVNWLPVAAYNAFTQWLENIRDNSISKQRYWGTPLPIWINQDDPSDIIVVGNSKELSELAGLKEEPKDLHIDHVDKIAIHKVGKDGTSHEYRRVPDVLDVWVDAGTTLWNCLGSEKENPDEYYPADFIVEGRDQIRGWFNLLHLMSVLLHGKLAFKNCYMHGYINDSEGRKMSKSLGNYILPEEVTEKYGVDVMRAYMIGATSPGLDMNYNFKDLDAKMKNFRVFWNLMKYSLDFKKNSNLQARKISEMAEEKLLDVEELYVLSKLHVTIKKVTEKFEKFQLNEVPSLVENFLLELSHNYLQLVWEKAASGSDSEKCSILSTMIYCLVQSMTLLAPISPYFSDRVYLNLKSAFPELSDLFAEESVHMKAWPTFDDKFVNEKLEKDFLVAQDAITAVLNARDRAGLGVKWPVKEVKFHSNSAEDLQSLQNMSSLVSQRTNTKKVSFGKVESTVEVHANKPTVRKTFPKKHIKFVNNYIEENRAKFEALIIANQKVEEELFEKDEKIGTITKEHLFFSEKVKEPFVMGQQANMFAYLDTSRSDELEWEGISREFVRRVQLQRKKLNLLRKDTVLLFVETSSKFLQDALTAHMEYVKDRSGCTKLEIVSKLEPASEDDVQSESLKREVAYRVALRKAS